MIVAVIPPSIRDVTGFVVSEERMEASGVGDG
jgi:hypothetical protein